MISQDEFKHLCRYSPVRAAEEWVKLNAVCEKLKANNDWLKEEFNKCVDEVNRLRETLKQIQGEKQ